MPFRLLLPALLAALTLPATAQTPPPLALDDAVALAAQQSAQLAARRAQARSATEMAVAAGQRPDPRLTLALTNVPVDGPQAGSITRDFMTMRSVGLMQTLTRDDKLMARRERMVREADIAAADEQVERAALQREAAWAWLDRSLQLERRDLLRALVDEARHQADAAEAVYRSGGGAQADLFASRASIERLHDRLDQAQRDADIAQARLARWIGEAAARAPAPRPALTRPPWTAADLDAALQRHPQVEAAARLRGLADAEHALADANRRADWSVELMFSQRGPSYSNMVSLNLSVPLQWDRAERQDREVAGRQAMRERADALREDRHRAALAEVRAALEAWDSHEHRLRRFDERLLPLAAQRSDAALAAYRAGGGSLAAVLAARSNQIDTRLDRLAIEAQIARVWADLHYLLPSDERTAP